ncbi:MAG: helix-turn-helix transcriptional regulator [Alphaproteobacteria bacterium]|nr:helix-turn-helix transcriptional regulator [Alphaproteobacteria bacterium]
MDELQQRTAFGAAVRNMRLRLGLSQEQLAARAQLHRTYIGSVERGERNVSLNNIYAIAVALETDAAHLLSDAASFHVETKPGNQSSPWE